jgi:hypothetical protein
MTTQRIIVRNGATLTELVPNTTSEGSADAGKVIALDSTGKVSTTMMPTGIGAETRTVIASEAIVAGAFVNIYTNSSAANVRNADASTTGKEANGFVLAAVASAGAATIYPLGTLNNQRTGMTPGATQYLSPTTPGSTTETIPSTAGQLIQELGVADSATEVLFAPKQSIVIA